MMLGADSLFPRPGISIDKVSAPRSGIMPYSRRNRKKSNHDRGPCIGRLSSRCRRLFVEQLEGRFLLTSVPVILPDGSVEITLDDAFDQFGFQPAIFQAYDATPENGFDDGLAGFSIFDTGASVVTFGANDQLLFSLLGSGGIPVGVECGAVAEAVGGLSLVGHVSERGTVLADGLHVSSLTFDEDGFPLFQLGFHDPEQGSVADPLPGQDDWAGSSNLAAVDDEYVGYYVSFTTGDLRGEVREVVDYAGSSRRFSFGFPFSAEPAAGDRFLLTAPVAPFVSETATGTVDDGSPSADHFRGSASSLSNQDHSYVGLYVEFTSGGLAGRLHQITDYVGATRTFHFANSFPAAPANGDTFRILLINTTPASIQHGIQAFLGTHVAEPPEGCPDPASPTLPTISGTPMLNPSAGYPNGLAVNIRPFGAQLDFTDFTGFGGFVIPVPDVHFQEPGQGVPFDPACLISEEETFRNICSDTMRIPLEFLGNLVDEDGKLSEAYNPVHNGVTVRHERSDNGQLVEISDQTFLFDTGAQLSVITPAIAAAFGLDLNSPEDTISVQTAGGVISDLPGYRIDSITVPMEGGKTLTYKNVWVFVVDAAPGLLDGILGMNLFNLASAMVYDPWHPTGPVLELKYFTENLFTFGFAEVVEIEPNDVPADATPIRPGEYGAGALASDDVVDYWAAPGASEGDLVFAYVDTRASSQSRDATLTLLDKNENPLAADDDDGPSDSPVIAGVPIPAGLAGTIFYEVRAANGGSIDEYAIYSAVVDPVDVEDEQEPGTGLNDTPSTAIPISRGMQTGTLGAAPGSGDVDHYEVLVTEGSRIVVMMDNDPDQDGQLTSTLVSILDPNGSEVFPPTGGDGDGNATAAGAVVKAASTGTYVVKVAEGAAGADNDYRFVTLVLDGGAELLAANLIQSAEAKKQAADNFQQEFEAALAACGPDLFCQIDVIAEYTQKILDVALDVVQAEVVLAFASTISPGSMPTFVDVGRDVDISLAAESISEKDGKTTATVRRPDTQGNLTVSLSASDNTAVTLPTTVLIPDGQRTSDPFEISAKDNTSFHGTKTVTITVSAAGYESGSAAIDIEDDELDDSMTQVELVSGDLIISTSELGGSQADTLELKIAGTNLLISDPNRPLVSNLPGAVGNGSNELQVPLSVIAGRIVIETKGGNDLLVLDASLTAPLISRIDYRAGPGSGDAVRADGAALALDVGQFTGVERIDVAGSGSNSLAITTADVQANLAGTNEKLIVVANADDQVVLAGSWVVAGTLVQDGVFFRVLQDQGVTVHLAGPHNWQNPVDPNDVTADRVVVPQDVLVVVNQLNNRVFLLTTGQLVAAATVDPFPMRFYDVDGNGFTTPQDALRIINFLISLGGEGENDEAGAIRTGSLPIALVTPPLQNALPEFMRQAGDAPSEDESARAGPVYQVISGSTGQADGTRSVTANLTGHVPVSERRAYAGGSLRDPHSSASERRVTWADGTRRATATSAGVTRLQACTYQDEELLLPDVLERLIDELASGMIGS
jgi:hypothetical protein